MPEKGRPRSFDRSAALQRAMELFWEHGYEGASLIRLQKAMGGITAPSFYAAFGSKEKLFREAVDLYMQKVGTRVAGALENAPTAKAGVEAMLRTAAEVYAGRGNPKGCLITLGATNCTSASVQEYLRNLRLEGQQMIKERLQRAVAAGEIRKGADVAAIASFYVSLAHGLAMRARDGVARKALNQAIAAALASWDSLVALDFDSGKD